MISTLRITSDRDADLVVIRLAGALDLLGATALLAATCRSTTAGARSVVYDLTELAEPPDHLLSVFAAAQRRVGPWPLHTVHLAGASIAVDRQLTRLGIARFVNVHRTTDDARATTRCTGETSYRFLRLESSTRSPCLARQLLLGLTGLASATDADNAAVVVSELTTNAVLHVREPFALTLALGAGQLLVGVTDGSRREPVVRPARADAVGGRGVRLVDSLSDAWGVRLVHERGKTVWARLTVRAA